MVGAVLRRVEERSELNEFASDFGSASAASLLLNLEAVATAAIAWTVFREDVDKRVGAGFALILFGGLSSIVAGTLGVFITTWATFVPCFLWIFIGDPHIEQLRENIQLTTVLSAVTAALVGVILNLAVWFGIHVLFPDGKVLDWFALALSAIAFIGLLRWKWDVIPVVIGSGLLAWLTRLACSCDFMEIAFFHRLARTLSRRPSLRTKKAGTLDTFAFRQARLTWPFTILRDPKAPSEINDTKLIRR